MIGSTGGGWAWELVRILAVDTVLQRHLWDIQGEVSRWLYVQAWGLERRSELGLWFLALCPLNACPMVVVSASGSLPSFDCGQAARIRRDRGTWCRPLGWAETASPRPVWSPAAG